MTGPDVKRILVALRHKKIHVAEDCQSAGLVNALRANGSQLCGDVSKAEGFVLKNPGKAAAGATLVSALRGAYQVSPSLLLSGQGDALKFKPIMMAPRVIFISRGCAAKQHVFCSLLVFRKQMYGAVFQ